MCSYNAVNGVPACFSSKLRDKLRGEWNFTGYQVSDTDAISTANNHHGYTNTDAKRVALALLNGSTDVESSVHTSNLYVGLLPTLVSNGTIPQSSLDQAAARTLLLRFRAGLFDPMEGQPFAHIHASDSPTPASLALAGSAARQSQTILKNSANTLPILKGKHYLVVGPLNGYQQHETSPQLRGQPHLHPDIFSAIKSANQGGSVSLEQGLKSVTDTNKSGFADAVAAVSSTDGVILCLGSDMSVEAEDHDRYTSALPGAQTELAQQIINAAHNQGKKVVLVLLGMGSLSIDTLKATVDAILFSFWPQPDLGAQAVALTLFGENVECCGKLPYTVYPVAYMQQVNMTSMSMTLPPGRSYKYYTGTPLWPFAFGLSLTNFAITLEELQLANTPESSWCFRVNVSNTGNRHGSEVVFVFFRPLFSRPAPPLPIRQLIDFQRVIVTVGERASVIFKVRQKQLATVNAAGEQLVLPGKYELQFTNGNNEMETCNVTIL